MIGTTKVLTALGLGLCLAGCYADRAREVAKCEQQATEKNFSIVSQRREFLTTCMRAAGYEYLANDTTCTPDHSPDGCYRPIGTIERALLDLEVQLRIKFGYGV
jgi:hypothetical protein